MKLLPILCVVALAASAGAASADTITINSFGQSNANAGYTAPATGPNTNTVTTFAGGTTYDIPNGGIWTGPIGASSWVSQDPGNYPDGDSIEPSGTYTFATTFNVAGTVTGGSLEVLADDTTSVSLNGILLVPDAPANPAQSCTVDEPNCKQVLTIDLSQYLSDFTAGTNTLTFGVDQDFGSAEGVDFSGVVDTVAPEPNSLLLLSTGILAMVGFFYYRRQNA